jgi:carbonic anhydrase
MKLKSLRFAALPVLALLFVNCPKPVPIPGPIFSYNAQAANGPPNWNQLPGSSGCAASVPNQSPVNIDTTKLTLQNQYLTFAGYMSNVSVDGDLENDSYTVQAAYKDTVPLTGRPSFTYYDTYYLDRVHFHFPSEHTIDGVRQAGEIHLVHRSAKGTYAVVAFLIVPGAANATLGQLFVANPGTNMRLHGTTKIDLSWLPTLLGSSNTTTQNYYQYTGSLTTPPCTGGIIWFVMKQTMTASSTQIAGWTAQSSFNNTNRLPEILIGTRKVESPLATP